MDPNNNTIPTAPDMPGTAIPEAPVIMPTQDGADAKATVPKMPEMPVMPTAAPTPEPLVAPETMAIPEPSMAPEVNVNPEPQVVAPVFNPATMATPAVGTSLSATDPLTMPEGPKAPDPIEEELKMPLKAAGPVPGSIGSSVSMTTDGQIESAQKSNNPFANFGAKKETPSVAFNDPAAQATAPMTANAAKPAKKKTSKTSMILIGVLGAVIIIALVVVLVMQMK
ncbi:hypothetical protein IKG68_02145 [Candidatus Saccharibacteria bacterium]|nr:hypothetical protein [Candidatus Saccharibacteria bacterium]